MFRVHQLPPGLIHITQRINPKCPEFCGKCPKKNVVWGSITICKASYWHHNTAKFHSSIPSLTHLWISRSLWDHLFGGGRRCLVVLIFKWKIYQFLEGGDSRKKNSFHVYMYAYAYQDHEDVNWRSVRGVKRNSWRFNSIFDKNVLHEITFFN